MSVSAGTSCVPPTYSSRRRKRREEVSGALGQEPSYNSVKMFPSCSVGPTSLHASDEEPEGWSPSCTSMKKTETSENF